MSRELNDNELARKDQDGVESRRDPMRVAWTVSDLTTSDSHALTCFLSCSVRIADNPADRRMFAEVFLTSRESVSSETVSHHFAPAMRAACSQLASQRIASDIVSAIASLRQEWISAIQKSASPVAFACGLELLPPFQLDVESHTFQREQIESIARARTEARTAGQVQHLQRASELLKQFHALRESAPELSAGKLLEKLSDSDRGATLQTLLLASAQEAKNATTELFAVSGSTLVQIDPRTTPPRLKLIQLPTDLGPLRSVQTAMVQGERHLLIGARSGVIVVSLRNPSSDHRLFVVPDFDSPLGFNAAVCDDSHLWASHGDAGIVGWNWNQPDRPAALFAEKLVAPPSSTPSMAPQDQSILMSAARTSSGGAARIDGARNLTLLHSGSLLYSLGSELIVRDHDSRRTLSAHSTSDIVGLIPSPRSVIAAHRDGTLAIVDRAAGQIIDVRRRSARLGATGAMPWLGDVRLLLATDDGPVDCIGLDDPLVTEYLSPYRGLKILSATADLIAAVSPDRQRIILWNSFDTQRPAGEVHVTGQTRHRIADIEFAMSVVT